MDVLNGVGAEDWHDLGTACNDDEHRAEITDELKKRGIDAGTIDAFLEEMQLQHRPKANMSNSKEEMELHASYDAMYEKFDHHKILIAASLASISL